MHRTDQKGHPKRTTTTTLLDYENDDERPFVCSLASIYSSGIHSSSLPMQSLSQPLYPNGDHDNDIDIDGEHTTTAEDASTLVLEPLGMSISFPQLDSDDEEDEHDTAEGGIGTPSTNSTVGWDLDDKDGAAVTSEWRFTQTHPRSAEYHHRNSLHPPAHSHQDLPPVVSFWMLWRGPLLVYFVAMGLPTLSAYLLQHDHWNRWSSLVRETLGPALVWVSHPAAPRLYWQEHIHPHYIVPVLEYWCQWKEDVEDELEQESYTSIAYWLHRLNWCPIPPPVEEEEVLIYYRSMVIPQIVDDWKQDLAITVALGTALTALRLLVLLLASSSSSSAASTITSTPPSTKPHEDEQDNHDENEREDKPPSSSESVCACPEFPGSALFRAVYGSCSAYVAWHYFHTADFWPSFVGGTGDLSHCWDRIAVDADDAVYHQDTLLLKYYVLAQASYCMHSAAFGWVARPWRGSSSSAPLLLLLVSLMQSVLALSLLFLAYTLASVRRLVAMGMFALNVSQALRYAWQMMLAVPAADGSGYVWWCRRTISSLLYWGTVLPSFVATNFYVYPLLWHSATTADEWRLDLEQELWKGAADQFLRLGHACLVFLLLDAALSLQNLVEPVRSSSGQERSRSH